MTFPMVGANAVKTPLSNATSMSLLKALETNALIEVPIKPRN